MNRPEHASNDPVPPANPCLLSRAEYKWDIRNCHLDASNTGAVKHRKLQSFASGSLLLVIREWFKKKPANYQIIKKILLISLKVDKGRGGRASANVDKKNPAYGRQSIS